MTSNTHMPARITCHARGGGMTFPAGKAFTLGSFTTAEGDDGVPYIRGDLVKEMGATGSEMATDLKILLENALDAAKTDPRWEGVYEKVMPRVRAWQAALAKAEGQS